MSEPQLIENRVVMFADICGSTKLYDQLGDELARRLIAACIDTMSAVVANHMGRIIKTIGDEILVVFATPEAGVEAACALQNCVNDARYEGGTRMHIRIGLHYGSFLFDGGDIFGDTVNVAARIASMARMHQIMTSQVLVEALPPHLASKAHRLMATEFKGKQDETEIFIVGWDDDDSGGTHIETQSTSPKVDTKTELQVRFGDTTVVINKERKQIMLGRGAGCDIVVPSNYASRQHVSIELRLGKYFIIDQSSNGTWVRMGDGQVEQISRHEMILRGAGMICLGQDFEDGAAHVIDYCVVAARE